MHFSRLRYTIVESDTRALEFFLGCISLVWGSWVVLGRYLLYPQMVDLLTKTGSPFLWALGGFVNGTLVIGALYYNYPRFRATAAAMFAFYWFLLTMCSAQAIPSSFFSWLSLCFALASVWVVTHRFAVQTPSRSEYFNGG